MNMCPYGYEYGAYKYVNKVAYAYADKDAYSYAFKDAYNLTNTYAYDIKIDSPHRIVAIAKRL